MRAGGVGASECQVAARRQVSLRPPLPNVEGALEKVSKTFACEMARDEAVFWP